MTEAERKEWIDNASYEQLLSKWRNAPSGSPWFAGEIGDYFAKVMKEKKKEVDQSGHVSASKRIGWDG